MYVVNSSANSIIKLITVGELIWQFGQYQYVWSITMYEEDKIYVIDSNGVHIFNYDETILRTIKHVPCRGLALCPSGNIHVACHNVS